MRCFWCRDGLTLENMTIDHYIPRSKGGSNELSNLRPSCSRCNSLRGNTMPSEASKVLASRISAYEYCNQFHYQ
ncbi:HNH endonuclease [Nostoc sp.]|uniref:HNH endonuclease n=1 Tax=Nostoc sp. TaxID=1180 RepID=UPI003FA549D4